jgi:hypothetical protein
MDFETKTDYFIEQFSILSHKFFTFKSLNKNTIFKVSDELRDSISLNIFIPIPNFFSSSPNIEKTILLYALHHVLGILFGDKKAGKMISSGQKKHFTYDKIPIDVKVTIKSIPL